MGTYFSHNINLRLINIICDLHQTLQMNLEDRLCAGSDLREHSCERHSAWHQSDYVLVQIRLEVTIGNANWNHVVLLNATALMQLIPTSLIGPFQV